DGDVDGIESEGGPRPVGARLALGQFVRREDLEEAMTGRPNPRGTRGKPGDVADAPVAARPNGEERQGHARHADGRMNQRRRGPSRNAMATVTASRRDGANSNVPPLTPAGIRNTRSQVTGRLATR